MVQEQPSRVGRRLSAVLAADVAGYSRLMGLDEAGTARILRGHRVVTDSLVTKHGGRIVKTTGDGLLLEFASVVDAVECAVATQTVMAERNEGIPQDRRMLFRIGINLGDILIEGDDILGDGVNVAARLEGIAEPGGICISSSAYDQVRGKLDVAFADLGEQNLKNIARPVRAYAVKRNGLGLNKQSGAVPHDPSAPRLSIVVLPFANIGGDPEQDYFADGVTETLTTDLSRIGGSFVIARNTAFTYKGKTWPLAPADALAEMGLRLYSINETGAEGLFQRVRQRPILRAVGSADRSDPAKMIRRLLAVALFDLPQTVIIPGQHMVRIRFQCPLVPDLRELVVAELAIRVADQVGDVRVIVVAECLKLLDRGSIVVAIIDRRIGCAISLSKSGIVDAGVFTGLFDPLAMGGFRARSRRRRFTDATATSSRRKDRSKRGRSNQRHRKRYQRRKPDDHPVGHANLLHSCAVEPRDPAESVYPGWLQTFPESFSEKRDLVVTVMLS
jgi:class 3 adenylate cyclase